MKQKIIACDHKIKFQVVSEPEVEVQHAYPPSPYFENERIVKTGRTIHKTIRFCELCGEILGEK